MSFYAIAKGEKTGIFNTWAECKTYTDGYKGPIFKKFSTKEEAERFILEKKDAVKNTNGSSAFDMLMKTKPKGRDEIIEVEDSVFEPDYYVYTDGSCSNNGKENALAGIGIYFGENDIRNVSQRIFGKQSNNTAELGAILHLYDIIEKDILSGKKLGIVTDSEYAIRCLTTYGRKCAQEGWKKDIPNKELVKKLYELYKDKFNVVFIHIMAHTGKMNIHSMGNDGADKLANKAIGSDECPYHEVPKLTTPLLGGT
jgi:ribonuclease HI